MKIFIPIKGMSQRVPNKNFRDFGGRPLWKHCLSKFSDFEIFIDTDNECLIKEIENNLDLKNVYAYRRSNDLMGHLVSVNLLIENFLDKYVDDNNELISQIHVTNPFLKKETLVSASKHLSGYYDSVVSCDEMNIRLWRHEIRENDNIVYIPINHNPRILEQTQDLSPVYSENSVFYIFTKGSFFKSKNRLGPKPYFFDVSFPQNLDIDTEKDWNFCTKILKLQQEGEI